MTNAKKSKVRHTLLMLESLVYRSCKEFSELLDDVRKQNNFTNNSDIIQECLQNLSEAWTRVGYARVKTNDLEVIKKEKGK